MPYGTVNLLHGVNPGETPVTCTAGIGTFIVEFATLSSLTGDPVFEDVARVALMRLWESRSDIGLVGRLPPFPSESSRPPEPLLVRFGALSNKLQPSQETLRVTSAVV